MNPKKILLSIPLASLLVLTPNVSASPNLSEYRNAQHQHQHQDPVLAPLNSASTVEEERAMFRDLVDAQSSSADQTDDQAPEQTAIAPSDNDVPSSWWSEFSRFLSHTDIQHLMEDHEEDFMD